MTPLVMLLQAMRSPSLIPHPKDIRWISSSSSAPSHKLRSLIRPQASTFVEFLTSVQLTVRRPLPDDQWVIKLSLSAEHTMQCFERMFGGVHRVAIITLKELLISFWLSFQPYIHWLPQRIWLWWNVGKHKNKLKFWIRISSSFRIRVKIIFPSFT